MEITPKTQERKELIKKAFDSMPDSFTSSEFVQKLLDTGAERHRLYLFYYLEYLKANCYRDSKKTWTKKESPTYSVSNSQGVMTTIGSSGTGHLFEPPSPNTFRVNLLDPEGCILRSMTPSGLEEEAIKYLKERGYKIFKTTTVEL
jgi:hypothetical protein